MAPTTASIDPLEASRTPPRAPRNSNVTNLLLIMLVVCCLISLSVNLFHGEEFVHHHPDMAMARAMKEFKQGLPSKKKDNEDMSSPKKVENEDTPDSIVSEEEEHKMNKHNPHDNEEEADDEDEPNAKGGGAAMAAASKTSGEVSDDDSKIAGLSCDAYGGPSTKDAAEMVYWQDIPSDREYISPLHAKSEGGRRQYMTFEPDGGGWNNIRMAMETIVGLAIAMGRTLVLPPEQPMYLLRNSKRGIQQRTAFSFAHFFPMHEMAEENAGLELMTMQDFLEAEAMTGNLVDKNTGEPSFPPGNRTDWNGEDVKILKEWLRNVTFIEHMWKPEHCLAAFPASGEHKDAVLMKQMQAQIHKEGSKVDQYVGHPVDVDGPPLKRMHENMAGRSELCVYDEAMQKQLVVHFMCYHKMRIRYLVHFYAFLYFEDWRQDLWMKRFMRDHMRYIDEIQCAAARVVKAVRERSRQRNPQYNGGFDTFHIRRGDFQFKTTRIDADKIYANSREALTENKTVYIATDERDKAFFNPMKEHLDVVFLNDYMHLLEGINTNYFGMIDQLVAAKGDVFVGCWFSTFTGFINRMRGYYSTKYKLPGYEEGVLPTTYYYATIDKKHEMQKYVPLRGGFFSREFPTSWRQINKGIDELPRFSQLDSQ